MISPDVIQQLAPIKEKIRSKRADSVLALKRNQWNLCEDVSLYLMGEEEKRKIRENGNYKRTSEKA